MWTCVFFISTKQLQMYNIIPCPQTQKLPLKCQSLFVATKVSGPEQSGVLSVESG